jgi:hypothetical protein
MVSVVATTANADGASATISAADAAIPIADNDRNPAFPETARARGVKNWRRRTGESNPGAFPNNAAAERRKRAARRLTKAKGVLTGRRADSATGSKKALFEIRCIGFFSDTVQT